VAKVQGKVSILEVLGVCVGFWGFSKDIKVFLSFDPDKR